MFFEILLLSVVVVTAWLGPMVLRRQPPGQRAYAWMLLADLGLAIVAFAARRGQAPSATADLLGFVAIGAAVCLVMLPTLLRDLSRRALASDRLRLAGVLVDLREHLQPHMGARAERELIDSIRAVREGRVDAAVDVLREARAALADPLARRRVDERVVLMYLSARRWQDAIDAYEAVFEVQAGPMSPQLWVEMVRAYCEEGELDRAAGLIERLEESPAADEPVLSFFINRGRLVFLAFVGRTSAVETILAPSGPLGMLPVASRHYWSGVARLHAGDRGGARSQLAEAARLSGRDRRARELAERTLHSVDEPGVAGPRAVSTPVAELADRLTTLAADAQAAPLAPAPRLQGVALRDTPVTLALVAINLAVAGLVALVFSTTGDLGALVRAGANLKSAVAVGEWWRLPASMFLHVGLLHLLINMVGLWILGRLVEQMYGARRMFALYMTAGIAGALASYLWGGVGTSMGASGAVFGLLGAAIAELGLHRDGYPQRWRGPLLGNLIFLTAANVGIGFVYPAIDQAAHLGGLVGGAAAAALLSRKMSGADTRPVRWLGGALVALGAAAVLYAAVGVATTSYGDTVAKYPRVEREVGGLVMTAPSSWRADPEGRGVIDYGAGLEILLERRAASADLDEVLARLLRSEEAALRRDQVASGPADQPALQLPPPWQTRELRAVADGLGGAQRFRIVIFGRAVGGEQWVGVVRMPEELAGGARPALVEALTTLRPGTAPAR